MDKGISQKDIFLSQEGDNYFLRNKNAVTKEFDQEVQVDFGKYLKPGQRILEIGCSTGYFLQYLHKKFGCQCYGIDPSKKAIDFGKHAYPSIEISVGTADNLLFEDEYFDFIFFGMCLYLVDRKLLMKIVFEADRVLKNKGLVMISDFDTNIPKKRPYKHYPGVFSYKMDYSKLFLAYPQYSLIEKIPCPTSSNPFQENPKERISSVIIYKDEDNAYAYESDD